jgi:hypothetical protein
MTAFVGLIEVIGLFGLAIGFGLWELRKTDRALRDLSDEEDEV